MKQHGLLDVSNLDPLEVAFNMNMLELIYFRNDLKKIQKEYHLTLKNRELPIDVVDELLIAYFKIEANLIVVEEAIAMYECLFFYDDTFGINDYIS